MIYSGWGNYPKIKAHLDFFTDQSSLSTLITQKQPVIATGNHRSYGDSALNDQMISTLKYAFFRCFDTKTGLLTVQAGALLSDIIDVFVPRGWFLKITPGTKWITIGGAIASDVHGKNHHIEGCFSQSVASFKIRLPEGKIVNCSKQHNPTLFKATCGGMGLTGLILEAQIYLKPITSKYIEQTTIKTQNLKETFDAFEKYKDQPYSVAWIDCLAKAKNRGKCLLMVGDFSDDGILDYQPKKTHTIPFYFPSFVLNSWSIRTFNWLYYHKTRSALSQQKVDLDTFFYPLDGLAHWNRMYGKKGFIQYQFILPKSQSYQGLEAILKHISDAAKGSFLAVLKLYGKSNENWLSFPLEGYSLALDFKIEKGLFNLLESLDKIVLHYQGRIYLSKDARMSQVTFQQGYPLYQKFKQFRIEQKMYPQFQSLQSQRLGI